MKIIRAASELSPGPAGACLAIGVFDGLHLGHQSVIGRAREDASQRGAMPVVVTFDPHPNAIVAPQQVPPAIYSLAKKLEVIASLGIPACWVIPFDKKFSEVTGEEFIRGLATVNTNVKSITVGETFKFGCRRSGDVPLLQTLGAELGFTVCPLPDVQVDGQPVSSTRIREAIRRGDFAAASRWLGRTYTLSGQVMSGAQLGRKLGYPTANLNVTGTAVPPAGVYAATTVVEGRPYRAAVNIGHRPTVYASQDGLCVEAYLLDFAGTLYGEELELTFLKKLREEAKFSSLAALQEQIGRDVAATRALSVTTI